MKELRIGDRAIGYRVDEQGKENTWIGEVTMIDGPVIAIQRTIRGNVGEQYFHRSGVRRLSMRVGDNTDTLIEEMIKIRRQHAVAVDALKAIAVDALNAVASWSDGEVRGLDEPGAAKTAREALAKIDSI